MNNHPEYTFVSQSVEKRASNNGRKTISDFELTDVIQNVDEHTSSDDEFVLEFTKAVFSLFGWKYYTTEALKKLSQTNITYDEFNSDDPVIGDDDYDPAKHFVDDDGHKQP